MNIPVRSETRRAPFKPLSILVLSDALMTLAPPNFSITSPVHDTVLEVYASHTSITCTPNYLRNVSFCWGIGKISIFIDLITVLAQTTHSTGKDAENCKSTCSRNGVGSKLCFGPMSCRVKNHDLSTVLFDPDLNPNLIGFALNSRRSRSRTGLTTSNLGSK